MQAKIVTLPSFFVAGLTVRTRNSDEFNPATAQIPALWGKFFATGVAENTLRRLPESPVYGVYSGYQNGADGLYNLTAGVAVDAAPGEGAGLAVEAGRYMVFEARGAMPQAVIAAWMEVWTHFQLHPELVRSFRTDFESYTGLSEAQIYIGLASE